MRSLGYGPDKPLQIKIATRNIAGYRDPAIIMIDHLSQIFIAGEIDVLDTSVWYTQLARKDFTVAMNVSGIGIHDPDVVFYEGYRSEEHTYELQSLMRISYADFSFKNKIISRAISRT